MDIAVGIIIMLGIGLVITLIQENQKNNNKRGKKWKECSFIM